MLGHRHTPVGIRPVAPAADQHERQADTGEEFATSGRAHTRTRAPNARACTASPPSVRPHHATHSSTTTQPSRTSHSASSGTSAGDCPVRPGA
jgi:hypothetical protein